MKFCSECRRCYDDETATCLESGHGSLLEAAAGNSRMIEGYRLESLVSTSSVRDVYRASRDDCGRPCIITTVRGDHERAPSFLNEAESATQLFHPCTADVYETGSLQSGEVFVVSEDTGNKTLRAFLDSKAVPEPFFFVLVFVLYNTIPKFILVYYSTILSLA